MLYYTIPIDILHTSSTKEFVKEPTFNIKLGDISSPDYTLDEIFAFLESADKPCIIAIDEFQKIANYPEKNVEELLRAKIQKLSAQKAMQQASLQHHSLSVTI